MSETLKALFRAKGKCIYAWNMIVALGPDMYQAEGTRVLDRVIIGQNPREKRTP